MIVQPKNNRDRIEIRFSDPEIRRMYAKLLAGRGRLTSLEDISRKLIVKAFDTPYEEVITVLSAHWEGFEGLFHLQIKEEVEV